MRSLPCLAVSTNSSLKPYVRVILSFCVLCAAFRIHSNKPHEPRLYAFPRVPATPVCRYDARLKRETCCACSTYLPFRASVSRLLSLFCSPRLPRCPARRCHRSLGVAACLFVVLLFPGPTTSKPFACLVLASTVVPPMDVHVGTRSWRRHPKLRGHVGAFHHFGRAGAQHRDTGTCLS